MVDREFIQKIDASLEAIRRGRIDVFSIGMTHEEQDAIQRLLDLHYSALKRQRNKLTANQHLIHVRYAALNEQRKQLGAIEAEITSLKSNELAIEASCRNLTSENAFSSRT